MYFLYILVRSELMLHVNCSIINQTVKFMQTVIILQTSRESDDKQTDNISIYDVPLTMKFTKRRKLEDEAMLRTLLYDLWLLHYN